MTNLHWNIGQVPCECAFAALKARAFAFASVAPRAADVLRANAVPFDGAVVSVFDGDIMVGYVALWPVNLAHASGQQDLALLGPLMVDPDYQSMGLGRALMRQILCFADAHDLPPILLVGDAEYYGQFGFVNAPSQHWAMPGLAAPARILLRSDKCLPADASVLSAFAPPRKKQAAA